MESGQFNHVIIASREFVTNAITEAINKEVNKNKGLTEYFLSKYFTAASEKGSTFYYDGKGKRLYYNLIPESKGKFDEDVLKLAREHKRLYIGMIDHRGENRKMFIGKNFGFFMEDLNLTIFDFLENLITLKYQNNEDKLKRDSRNCMLNISIKRSSENAEDTKGSTDAGNSTSDLMKKEIFVAKFLNENLDEQQKDALKESIYRNGNESPHDDIPKTLLVYVGCSVILETDKTWLDVYTAKMKK